MERKGSTNIDQTRRHYMINEFYFNKLYSHANNYKDFSAFEQQPKIVLPVVTQADAESGALIRYFIRHVSNKSFVVEIDETQYDLFQQNPRFITCKIRWKIVGVKETSYLPSGLPIYGVADINRQTVANADLTFGGLRQYIQDYAEYWVAERVAGIT